MYLIDLLIYRLYYLEWSMCSSTFDPVAKESSSAEDSTFPCLLPLPAVLEGAAASRATQ